MGKPPNLCRRRPYHQELPAPACPSRRWRAVTPSVIVEEPKPELERPTVWGEPTEVQVGIYVIDVDEVNSADQSFAASVYFERGGRIRYCRTRVLGRNCAVSPTFGIRD